jgi:hypothetical protein
MSQEPQEPTETQAADRRDQTNQLRRRLLRGGLAGAPVLLTLQSRSVMACHSTTPSAFGSISQSRPENLISLSGQPPSWWCNTSNYSQWPSGYRPVDKTVGGTTTYATKMQDVFQNCGTTFGPMTLVNVLKRSDSSGTGLVAKCVVAALLNGASGRTSAVLDADAVRRIWNGYRSNGYFEPTAGVKWYDTWHDPSSPAVTAMYTAGGGGISGYLYTTWT